MQNSFERQLSAALAQSINETTVERRQGTVGFQRTDGSWDVSVPNGGPRIYVTVDEGRVIAINLVAPLVTGFPVSVAYYPGREPVVDRLDSFAAAEFMKSKYYAGVAPHSHRFTSGNPDYIEPMRLEPGLVVPDSADPLIVRVLPFFYRRAATWVYCAGGTLDLTAFVPTDPQMQRWVLVGVNIETGALEATDGADFDDDDVMGAEEIADIVYTGIRLAAIRLMTDQTAAPVVATDYVDAREWFGASGGESIYLGTKAFLYATASITGDTETAVWAWEHDEGDSYKWRIEVCGRSSDLAVYVMGEMTGYTFRPPGGDITFVGTPALSFESNTALSAEFDVVVDTGAQELIVNVTGETGATWDWRVAIERF